MKRTLWIVLCLLIIAVSIGRILYAHAGSYTGKDYWERFAGLQRTYNQSQYVNKHPAGWIPDETVNAYAGGAYIRGISPILIAPDTPPFGRYLIGVSAVLFQNENIVTLLFFLGALVLVYVSAYELTKSVPWSLIPVVITSIDPLLTNQLVYTPLLDIMQLVFLLGSLLFFSRGFRRKSNYSGFFVLAGTSLGMFIATKFFITGIVVIAAWLFTILVTSKFRKLYALGVSVVLSVAVLLASYVNVLFTGYSLRQFLGIQKWVYAYHQSQLILPFTVWPLIFFNRWYVWFGNQPVISDPQWNILWPLGTLAVLIVGVLGMLRKIRLSEESLPFILWAWLYLGFLSLGQSTSRYLVIFMPTAYIIGTYGLWKAYETYKKMSS